MAKIEEITALLINEIESFENALKELKKESDKLHNKEFVIDTSQIKIAFKEFDQKLSSDHEHRLKEVYEIQKKLNKKIIIPKWVIILVSSFFIITILSLTYNFYQYQSNIKLEKEAYQKGKTQIETHIFSFFDSYPKSYKNYKKWQNEK